MRVLIPFCIVAYRVCIEVGRSKETWGVGVAIWIMHTMVEARRWEPKRARASMRKRSHWKSYAHSWNVLRRASNAGDARRYNTHEVGVNECNTPQKNNEKTNYFCVPTSFHFEISFVLALVRVKTDSLKNLYIFTPPLCFASKCCQKNFLNEDIKASGNGEWSEKAGFSSIELLFLHQILNNGLFEI